MLSTLTSLEFLPLKKSKTRSLALERVLQNSAKASVLTTLFPLGSNPLKIADYM